MKNLSLLHSEAVQSAVGLKKILSLILLHSKCSCGWSEWSGL